MPDPKANEANAAIWAGVGGILGGLAVTILAIAPDMNVSGTTASYGTGVGAGAFWGWALAEIRNWLGRRGR